MKIDGRLGMYVHMHWGYSHPYSARTWSLEDWRGYAHGLKSLGYSLMMIWPIADTVPLPMTPSDEAFLGKIHAVIDMLHQELDFYVVVCLSPNTIGNEHAAEYAFETRPFFKTDVRLNPGDPDEMDELFKRRRAVLEYLGNADAIAVIDSDPGGYPSSTNEEFADLLCRYMRLFSEFNPGGKLYYWMWIGWEAYNKFWRSIEETGQSIDLACSRADCEDVAVRLMESPHANWGLFSCFDVHQEIVERLNLCDRTMFFPYGTVEAEPSFPLTNFFPDDVRNSLARYKPDKMNQGVMANAQTHLVQLPHTYLFAHYAQGGSLEDCDIDSFAGGLIPELGALISRAWISMWPGDDPSKMREIAASLAGRADENFSSGRYSSLLLGGAGRFVRDLSLQLEFRAAAVDFVNCVRSDADVIHVIGPLCSAWEAWQQRTGFADAFCESQGLLAALKGMGDPDINAVLDDFDNWVDPSCRHGITLRLLKALREYRSSGPA